MLHSRQAAVLIVCGTMGVFGCSGDDAAKPARAGSASAQGTGGTATGSLTGTSVKIASVNIPANLQGPYQQLPPLMRARFEKLPEDMQRSIIARVQSLPPNVRARLERRVAQSGARRGQQAPTAQNDAPDAIFKTNPPAGSDGVIAGTSPFTVTFNACKTTDVDAGDEMKYLYDYDGTGNFERGRCRETHTYQAYKAEIITPFETTVCVSDRQEGHDHDICKSFKILVHRGGKQCKTVMAGSAGPTTGGGDFETAFFDVLQTQTVTYRIDASSAAPSGADSFYFGTGFDCGSGFNGYDSKYTSGYDTYQSYYSGDQGEAPQNFSGCYAYAYGGSLNGTLFNASWKTQVCDPQSF
jgi:hypothetical protein